MHKIITFGLGAALLAASVACAPVDPPTDDQVRENWHYGFYVELIASDMLGDGMGIAEGETTNAPAATLALDDHYRQ